MTAATERITTTAKPTANPHHVGTVITGWAIPLIFVGALWGAGHDPANASWSALAFVVIVALHLVQRIRRNVWARHNRSV